MGSPKQRNSKNEEESQDDRESVNLSQPTNVASAVRSRLCVGLCVVGLLLALFAVALLTVTVVNPLWTSWGWQQSSKVVIQAYDGLFLTEEEALREMGLAPDCPSSNETFKTGDGARDVQVWRCPQSLNKTGVLARRKRQVSDYDNSCATELFLTMPMNFWSNAYGATVHVVHFYWTDPQRFQFVHEAVCGAAGVCTAPRSCVRHGRMQPLLVSRSPLYSMWDLIDAVYYQSVWFESYDFPGNCKCV